MNELGQQKWSKFTTACCLIMIIGKKGTKAAILIHMQLCKTSIRDDE